MSSAKTIYDEILAMRGASPKTPAASKPRMSEKTTSGASGSSDSQSASDIFNEILAIQETPELSSKYEDQGGFGLQFDENILKTVGDTYKSQWGDKYYYDMFDADDYRRAQSHSIPKYLEKKYNLNDSVDRYLYDNGLPYRELFNDMYSAAMLEAAAAQAEAEAEAEAAAKAEDPAAIENDKPLDFDEEAPEKKEKAGKGLDLSGFFESVGDSLDDIFHPDKADLALALNPTEGAGRTAFGDDWERWSTLSESSSWSKEDRAEARAALKKIRAYARAPERWWSPAGEDMEILRLESSLDTKLNGGFGAGFLDALGADWLFDRAAGLGEKIAGVEGWRDGEKTVQEQIKEVEAMNPGMSTAGQIGGTLALTLSALSGAKAATGAIKGFGNLPRILQNAITRGITFGATGAYRGITDVATKSEWDKAESQKVLEAAARGEDYEPQDYKAWGQVLNVLTEVGRGTLSGTGASVASDLVSVAGISVLAKNPALQTAFADWAMRTLSSFTYGATYSGIGYLTYPKGSKPTKRQITRDLAVTFLFSMITSAVDTAKVTAAQKQNVSAAVENMQREYYRFVQNEASMTNQEKIDTLNRVMAYNEATRQNLQGAYIAGQGKWIQKVLESLDAMDDIALKNIESLSRTSPLELPGGAGLVSGAPIPGAGLAPVGPVEMGTVEPPVAVGAVAQALTPIETAPAGPAPIESAPFDPAEAVALAGAGEPEPPQLATREEVQQALKAVADVDLPEETTKAIGTQLKALAAQDAGDIAPETQLALTNFLAAAQEVGREAAVLNARMDAKRLEAGQHLEEAHVTAQDLVAQARSLLDAGDVESWTRVKAEAEIAIQQYNNVSARLNAAEAVRMAEHQKKLAPLQQRVVAAAAELENAVTVELGRQNLIRADQTAPDAPEVMGAVNPEAAAGNALQVAQGNDIINAMMNGGAVGGEQSRAGFGQLDGVRGFGRVGVREQAMAPGRDSEKIAVSSGDALSVFLDTGRLGEESVGRVAGELSGRGESLGTRGRGRDRGRGTRDLRVESAREGSGAGPGGSPVAFGEAPVTIARGIRGWGLGDAEKLVSVIESWNQDKPEPVNLADVYPVMAPTESAKEIFGKLRSLSGRDFFLYAVDAGKAPGGFRQNGELFVRQTSGGIMAFHGGHEWAHDDSAVLQAGAAVFDRLPESVFDGLRESREARLHKTHGSEYTESLSVEQLKEEFICNMFGAYIYEHIRGKSLIDQLGVDESVYAEFEHAFAEVFEAGMLEDMGPDVDALGHSVSSKGAQFSPYVGLSEDGKPIYKSVFPAGMRKSEKQAYILKLIQDVWSKKPITLTINKPGEGPRQIIAQFDPTIIPGEYTDATKLVSGSRHGTDTDQRITLNLAPDMYEIAQNVRYNYSKDATSKPGYTHEGVKEYHYFIDNIVYERVVDGELRREPCTVLIDVKDKGQDQFFYEFSVERVKSQESQPEIQSSGIPASQATEAAFNNIISEDTEISNPKTVKFSSQDLVEPLYSKLQREVEAYKGDKIAAAGLVPYLRGRGVKAEEIKWSGLESFIDGRKSVPKDELLTFLQGYQIQVVDVTKSDNLVSDYTDEERYRLDRISEDLAENVDAFMFEFEKLSGRQPELIDIYRTPQLGWNCFRLIQPYLRALDEGNLPLEKDDALKECREIAEELQALEASQMDIIHAKNVRHANTNPKFDAYASSGGENYREVLFTLPLTNPETGEVINERFDPRKGNYFRSPHWDEENVLAHTRLQDFTAADGGNVLFVDEVQSDWHEKGREKGYVSAEERARYDQLRKDESDTRNRIATLEQHQKGGILSDVGDTELADLRLHSDIVSRELRDLDSAIRGSVMDAPFRETWHEYVLKRVIRMAAEGDYDYVAWTTGEMQADRYNLSAQIDSIDAISYGNGRYDIIVHDADGYRIDRVSGIMFPDKIISIFGKDLGGRIMKAADDQMFDGEPTGAIGTIKGGGLKIGGEGMRNFYDIGGASSQNIPRFLNKYVKQWGSGVQSLELENVDSPVPAIRVTTEMKDSVLREGQPLFSSQELEEPGEDAPKRKSMNLERMAKALELFEAGKTPADYAKEAGRDFDYSVALRLRDMHLKNGNPMGGALPAEVVDDIIATSKNWNQPARAALSLTMPARVFENLGSWRSGDLPSDVAMNYREGERLRDTYWYYGLKQGADMDLWQNAERAKVYEAFGKSNAYVSALAQLLGEKYLTREDAGKAVADSNTMIVPLPEGVLVFDKHGQLKLMSDGARVAVFDEKYRERMRDANKAIANIVASNDPKMGDAEKQEAIRQAIIRAKGVSPNIRAGAVRLVRDGNSVNVVDARTGVLLERVVNGKTPDIETAVQTAEALRDFYSRVLLTINRAMIENGQKPVGEITDYFPHQGRVDLGITQFIATLRGDAETLPTEISGLTSMFQPGKPWFSNMLSRMGTYTEFDAIRGFNKYLKGAGDVIYFTPVIQRLRQLEKALRMQSEGATNTALVAWLRSYANHMANKKADIDRAFEDIGGRAVYTVSDKLTRLFGAAAVAGNVASGLSNMISFLASIPSLDARYIPGAVARTIWNNLAGQDDGLAERVPFLVRRFEGYESILTSKTDRVKRAGGKLLGVFFSAVDRLATESAVRAKYVELKEQGLSDEEAAKRASTFANKVFADRSKGMTASFFTSKLFKPFVQFQLEVTNQMSHFRDIRRQGVGERYDDILRKHGDDFNSVDWAEAENSLRAGGIKDWARFAMYLLLMSLWGAFTRWAMGRDQTWNPYGMAKDFVHDYKEDGLMDAMLGLGENALEQSPFSSLITGGGRIPALGGIENVWNAIQALVTGDETAGDLALRAITSFIPGGGQMRKTITGAQAIGEGGSYTAKGSLRYPIEEEDYWKALVFGPSAAAPEGYAWGKDQLSESQTEGYEALTAIGIDKTRAYGLMKNYDGRRSNARRALSILTADSDNDGKRDFDDRETNLIAAVLGLSYDPKKDGTLEDWARENTESYLTKKKKESESGKITADEYEELAAEYEDFWNTFMGLE